MSQPLKYLCHDDLAKVSSGEIKYLHTPFPTWIMGLNLMCLGIIFGYDNRKHSVDGVKYGYLGSRRAVEQLADELHLSHYELAQKISKR